MAASGMCASWHAHPGMVEKLEDGVRSIASVIRGILKNLQAVIIVFIKWHDKFTIITTYEFVAHPVP
jgi:hypothetical protein